VYLTVYNIVTRSEENVFLVIENDKFMKTLKKAMTSEEEIVRGKVCEMIDIFAAKGNPEQILKMVTEHNFLGCLITMIEHENILIQKLGLDACLKVLNSGNIISDYNPYLLYFEEAEVFDKIMLLMSYPDLTDTAALILTFLEGDNMGY